MKIRLFFLITFFTLSIKIHQSKAQGFTQTIRGTVVDAITQNPLSFSTVVLINSDPINGTVTDTDGKFELKNVSVGKQALKISFLGYKEQLLQNIVVTSGKEVVLSIGLEENIIMGKEVTITGHVEKNKPLNEFTTVSGRTFSVEETQKYAAAVNDPARMSTAFAGVVSTDDGNNTIAIRGNSPNGLLWRMEGVEIPNPNHFSSVASSGGGISILSSQLLTNSDFLTGAFPAEYGNALSGVFDMKLRKGNNKKTERTIQLGILGTDVAIEGPFKKDYNGSYLFNYRYSTLSVIEKLGVSLGGATTTFQDLSFNIFLPTNKYGNFSLFGFGGLSKQYYEAEKDSMKWENNYDRYNWDFKSNTGAAGLSHFIQLSKQAYLKTTVLASGNWKTYQEEKIDNNYKASTQEADKDDLNKISVNSILTKKFNSRNSVKAGLITNKQFFTLRWASLNKETNIIESSLNQKGNGITIQSFVQWNFKATKRLTINSGIHSLAYKENNTYSVEPRLSFKYDLTPKQSISIGYGLHQQAQPLGVYYGINNNSTEASRQVNKDLKFSKAHHFVVAYDRSVTEYMRIKVEGYYQSLFDIPVSADSSNTYSLLNNEFGYFTDALVNDGAGKNYGLELSLEQFLHHDFYFLLSSSLYNSEYRASNNQWYNTRFNGKFAISLTAGKEIKTGEGFGNRIIGINIKSIYSGGLRNTPIDYEASVKYGETKYIESRPYELQAANYFRIDTKFSVKRNRPKSTITWSLDLQNATNHQNVFGEYFDPLTGKTKVSYQAPLIPVLSYKIDF